MVGGSGCRAFPLTAEPSTVMEGVMARRNEPSAPSHLLYGSDWSDGCWN